MRYAKSDQLAEMNLVPQPTMTNRHRIYLVDVFTDQAYSGNPLAVVACSEPQPEPMMLMIPAESHA